MLKALIPIEKTLASNIALRYACQKSKIITMTLQPIHVEEPDEKPHSSQTGWIRRSWEEGLKQAGEEEVREILSSEELNCYVQPRPIVTIGERSDKILEELRMGNYNIFIEGELSNFNTAEFRKKIRSKLYKKMPCPALLVKNMIQSDKVLLIVDPKSDLESLTDQFNNLLTNKESEFDLCLYSLDDLNQGDFPDDILGDCTKLLNKYGLKPGRAFTLLCAPEVAAVSLKGYGLIVSAIDRKSSRKSHLTEVLARVSCPLLLCWTYSNRRK